MSLVSCCADRYPPSSLLYPLTSSIRGWISSFKLSKYLLLGSTVLKQVMLHSKLLLTCRPSLSARLRPWLLLCNAGMLTCRAQESPLIEHYYQALRPGVHYVPFYAGVLKPLNRV